MAHLFNNKYRIPSARLKNWNYANEAMYFVTICTKNRIHYFGKIGMNHDMMVETQPLVETQSVASLPTLQPTEIGKIAFTEWYKSIELRPDMNLELGEFVIMPNHIHGIIIIGANEYNTPRDSQSVETQCITSLPNTISDSDTEWVETQCISSLPKRDEYSNQFGPQSKNLASIIRGYKSAVTTYARKNGIDFEWQPRFHDHIIRSMDDYHRISNYIINNPAKWHKDKFYK